jgi:selenocysteine lyase/cysteine desulfurase
MKPIPCQRHFFDIPADIAYFNCGYMSPLARSVQDALHAGARLKSSPWTFTAADFRSYPEDTRASYARLVGCDADRIAIVPSASYGLAVAARNVAISRGQKIVLLGDQFPSNVYIWRERAELVGAGIVHVLRDSQAAWTEAVLDAIGPDTAVVAVPHCHWADGGFVDLVRVSDACRLHGAALVLDLTQSLGAMPFDVARVDPDFMVAAGYKWLMAPYGTGLLYVAPRHHDGIPIEQNWLNREGSEDFARLVDYRDTFQPGARRFDMGEMANPPLLMGARAAIDLLLGWGVEAISRTLGVRTGSMAQRAAAAGLFSLPDDARAPHFLSLSFPNGLPHGLAEKCAEAKVYVSIRGQSLRITPHLYNSDDDVDRLFSVLGSLAG